MIDEIKKDVEKLVEEELRRCIKTKGLFVDGHQAHGAIREEVEETVEDVEVMVQRLNNIWTAVRRDEYPAQAIHQLKICAINAACEAIQVAAMARKYQQSFRKEGKK